MLDLLKVLLLILIEFAVFFGILFGCNYYFSEEKEFKNSNIDICECSSTPSGLSDDMQKHYTYIKSVFENKEASEYNIMETQTSARREFAAIRNKVDNVGIPMTRAELSATRAFRWALFILFLEFCVLSIIMFCQCASTNRSEEIRFNTLSGLIMMLCTFKFCDYLKKKKEQAHFKIKDRERKLKELTQQIQNYRG